MSDADVVRLRNELLLQLEHLVDEIEATKVVSRRLNPLETESRLGGPSVKERYGIIADWDRTVILPLLKRMQQESMPNGGSTLPEIERWNVVDLQDILEAVQHERRTLLDYLKTLPVSGWARTGVLDEQTHDVFGLLHALIQHDVEQLQSVAQQLRRTL